MHKKLMIAHVDEEKTQKIIGILHGQFGIFVCVTSKISGGLSARQFRGSSNKNHDFMICPGRRVSQSLLPVITTFCFQKVTNKSAPVN
jgi:hypothetical protein